MKRLGLIAPRLGVRGSYALKAFAGQIVFSAVAFGGSVATAHLLGPEGKGKVTAWALAAALGSLTLGLTIPTGLGRAFLLGKNHLLSSAVLQHGGMSAVAGAIAAGGALTLGLDPVAALLFLVVAIPAGVVVQNALTVFQASKSPWRYQLIRTISVGVFSIGMVGAWLLGAGNDVHLAFVLFAGGALGAAIAAQVTVHSQFGWYRGWPLRRVAELGRGSFLASFFDWVLLRCDQFVVVALLGPAALGIYGVAVNWAELGQYLGHSVGQAVFEDERTLTTHAAIRIFWRAGAYVGALTVAVGGVGFIMIEPIFGSQFADARWALLLLAPGIPARTVGYAGAQMLLARGAGARASRISASTAAFALVAWLGGASLWSIRGAAAATTLVYIVQMLLIVRVFSNQERPAGRPNG